MTAPTDPQTAPTAPAAAPVPPPASPVTVTTTPLATAPAPAPGPATNGCLKAFVIGSLACFVLGILAVGGLVMLGKKAADDIDTSFDKTFGVAAAQDYKLEVQHCDIDDFNNPKASGTIVNNADHRQAYEIKIDFVDDANVKVSNGVTFSGALDKGQTGTWSVPTFDDAGDKPISCNVAEVSYTPFGG
jgi:hypothetical protein